MKKLVKTTLIIIFLTIIIASCEKEENPEIINCTTFELGGKQYETVQIVDQCWMAENLDFNAGEGCWETPGAIEKDGRYYTWEAAKRVCPSGWHIPTKDDWEELMQYISDQNGGYEKKVYGKDSFIWYGPGVHLKTSEDWIFDDGTNDYGFSALPVGYRSIEPSTGDVLYNGYERNGFWWSSSNDGTYACHCFVSSMNSDFAHYITEAHLVNNGLSVRYIKD